MVVRFAACIGNGAGAGGFYQRLHGHAKGGTINKQDELNSYIARLRSRLQLSAWLRGAAIFTGTALAITVALVLVLNRFAFPAHGVGGARFVVLGPVAGGAVLGISLPLMGLAPLLAGRAGEAANPD